MPTLIQKVSWIKQTLGMRGGGIHEGTEVEGKRGGEYHTTNATITIFTAQKDLILQLHRDKPSTYRLSSQSKVILPGTQVSRELVSSQK